MKVTPEYALLSMEAGWVAAKVQELGDGSLAKWVRMNSWELTPELLEELKRKYTELLHLSPGALDVPDEERKRMREFVQTGMRLQEQVDAGEIGIVTVEPQPRHSEFLKAVISVQPLDYHPRRHEVLLACGHVVVVFGDISRLEGLVMCTRCRDRAGEA